MRDLKLVPCLQIPIQPLVPLVDEFAGRSSLLIRASYKLRSCWDGKKLTRGLSNSTDKHWIAGWCRKTLWRARLCPGGEKCRAFQCKLSHKLVKQNGLLVSFHILWCLPEWMSSNEWQCYCGILLSNLESWTRYSGAQSTVGIICIQLLVPKSLLFFQRRSCMARSLVCVCPRFCGMDSQLGEFWQWSGLMVSSSQTQKPWLGIIYRSLISWMWESSAAWGSCLLRMEASFMQIHTQACSHLSTFLLLLLLCWT